MYVCVRVQVQILETEVIVMVNQLAKIVHDKSISWSGNPTMNSGGAFLLSWKLPITVRDDLGSGVSGSIVLDEGSSTAHPLLSSIRDSRAW